MEEVINIVEVIAVHLCITVQDIHMQLQQNTNKLGESRHMVQRE